MTNSTKGPDDGTELTPPAEGSQRLSEQLNLETAKIAWHELQPWFAQGAVICVAKPLDLLVVAEQLAADNAALVQDWMQQGRLEKVSDSQATDWYKNNTLLWAVVIKPWVVVQES